MERTPYNCPIRRRGTPKRRQLHHYDAFGANHLPLFLVPIKTFLDNSGERTEPKETAAATIAIVSVLDGAAALSEFQLALSTVRCYCQRNPARYAHFVLFSPPLTISTTTTRTDQDKCDLIGDFMFRRHCVMSAWLANHPSYEWILFLDADMAVVNPFHDVEEFVTDSGIELVLLERMFNFEIMAGSYLKHAFRKEFSSFVGQLFLSTSQKLSRHRQRRHPCFYDGQFCRC
uniref:Nucleotide-diphospho-sugar transferase n=1 Tax=Globodera pallida TaxID=36090 RepID=A0A183CK28_GLOPA